MIESAVSRAFPLLRRRVAGKRLVYLDSACSALRPEPVIRACAEHERRWGGCGGRRSAHPIARESEGRLEAAREVVRSFLGARSAREVVFTAGATDGLNRVLRSFPYTNRRDTVVATSLEHNSAFLPLHERARRGRIRLKLVEAEQDGSLDLDRLSAAVTERTALVVATHASNVYGGVQPVAEIARRAHARGACLLVDDAQFVASHREDVAASGADFAVFSAHKLGGPGGVGVLWGRSEQLRRLHPDTVGGGTVRSIAFSPEDVVEYLDLPHRLEAGTPNHTGVAGLAAAIDFLEGLGLDSVRGHVADLVGYAWDRLEGLEAVSLLGRRESAVTGSIVAFHFADPRASEADFGLFAGRELEGCSIALRVGRHCADLTHHRLGLKATVRLSFFVYNTRRDVDRLVEALKLYLASL